MNNVACAVAVAVLSLLDVNQAFSQLDTSNSGKHGDDVWVRDVRSGVKLYGREGEFSAIGRSTQFDLSPDDRTIVFAGDHFSQSREIKFWDVESRKITRKLQMQHDIRDVTYTADGRKLFVTERPANPEGLETVPDALFSVWDAVTLRKIASIAPPARQGKRQHTCATISPAGDRVALSHGDRLLVHDADTGDIVSEFTCDNPGFLIFSGDGKQLVDMKGHVIDVETGELTGRLPGIQDNQYMNWLSNCPRSNLVAGAIFDNGVRLFNLDTDREIKLQRPDSQSIQMFPVAISNDGRFLAAGSSHYPAQLPGRFDFLSPAKLTRSRILVWDTESGGLVSTTETRGGHLGRIRFSADSQRLFTKSWIENGVTVYDIHQTRNNDGQDLVGNVGPISGFHFFDRQNAIVVSSTLDPVIIYDLKTGRPIDEIYDRETCFLDTTRSGKFVVAAGEWNNFVSIYDTEKKKTKLIDAHLQNPPSPIASLADLLTGKPRREVSDDFAISDVIVADDNRHLMVVAVGTRFVRIQYFKLSTGRLLRQKQFPLEQYADGLRFGSMMPNYRRAVAAPDGKWLAIASVNKDIFIIDAESGKLLHELAGAGDSWCNLYATPDSKNLIVLGRTLKFIDVETGETTQPSPELKPAGFLVAVSSSGNRLAMITADAGSHQTLKVYELEDLQEPSQIFSQELDQKYLAIGISRLGTRIALARTDNHFEILDLDEL